MSSIDSINLAQPAAISTFSHQGLSTLTKQKLEALGIDPSTVTSEAQAQALIARAEEAQKQLQNLSQKKGGNSSEQELLSEAKSLASEVGVTVSSDDSLNDVIHNISNEIQIMMDCKDKSKISEGHEYMARLANISDRATSVQNTQQNIFNSLDMTAISNKYALGL